MCPRWQIGHGSGNRAARGFAFVEMATDEGQRTPLAASTVAGLQGRTITSARRGERTGGGGAVAVVDVAGGRRVGGGRW